LANSTAKIRVLLVEDEKKLARAIARQLERAGYEVCLAFEGQSALESITTREIQLIVLDINLPDISGIDVLQQLRARSYNTPVLFLTARDGLKDKINGLNLGADDYITKPFDSSELLSRMQAILRRSGAIRVSILEAEDLTMDVVSRVVRRAGQMIVLTQTEFALLEFFLRNKNVILTRRRIAEQVWGYKFETGTNIVDVYISYLRDSIDKNFSPKLIETIRGEGFMLKAK
jgi:two-component system copper resistance phosphate regulon response regulator CusR